MAYFYPFDDLQLRKTDNCTLLLTNPKYEHSESVQKVKIVGYSENKRLGLFGQTRFKSHTTKPLARFSVLCIALIKKDAKAP